MINKCLKQYISSPAQPINSLDFHFFFFFFMRGPCTCFINLLLLISFDILICRAHALNARGQRKLFFFFPTLHFPSPDFHQEKWVSCKLSSSRKSLKLQTMLFRKHSEVGCVIQGIIYSLKTYLLGTQYLLIYRHKGFSEIQQLSSQILYFSKESQELSEEIRNYFIRIVLILWKISRILRK